MKSFEEMLAWQAAKRLARGVFTLGNDAPSTAYKIWHSQLSRASLSVMNNLAEGFERGTGADMSRFYQMAKGSCAEVRSLIILGQEVGYLSSETAANWREQTIEIRAMIIGLMRALAGERGFRVKEESATYGE